MVQYSSFLLILGEGITAQAVRGESISIKDATGRSVEVRLPVKKLVVLNSDALEVIRALRAEDLVVGVNTSIIGDTTHTLWLMPR